MKKMMNKRKSAKRRYKKTKKYYALNVADVT